MIFILHFFLKHLPVVFLAAFNLGKFFDDAAASGNVARDGFALRIEAKAAFTLPVG